MKTNADAFYGNLPGEEAAAASYLASLINSSGVEEMAWRDFKVGNLLDGDPKGDDKLKEILSENLSAFANSGGGVLIFGFRTNGRIPSEMLLANDAARLRQRILELVNDATDPPVTGVEARAVRETAMHPNGFVVLLIPSGNVPPYQATWAQQAYWFRSQDSNFVMSTAQLRMLFHPRARVRLHAKIHLNAAANIGSGGWTISVQINLNNRGPGTADDVLIDISSSVIEPNIQVSGGWTRIHSERQLLLRHPILPNLVLQNPILVSGRVVGDFNVTVRVFARDIPVHYVTLEVTREMIEDAAVRTMAIERDFIPWELASA